MGTICATITVKPSMAGASLANGANVDQSEIESNAHSSVVNDSHIDRSRLKKRVKIRTKKGNFYIDKRITMKYKVLGCLSSTSSSLILKVVNRIIRKQFVIKVVKKIKG